MIKRQKWSKGEEDEDEDEDEEIRHVKPMYTERYYVDKEEREETLQL
jgi:hypothetical protein